MKINLICSLMTMTVGFIFLAPEGWGDVKESSNLTSDYACNSSDLIGNWRIYRRDTDQLKAHIRKGTLNIRETSTPNLFRVTGSLVGGVGADWNGNCEATGEYSGLYVIRGHVDNHDCDHTVVIVRGDGHAGNYAEECDDLTGDAEALCKILSNLMFDKHILVTIPDHDSSCPDRDPGHHGGSAHGGND